MILGVLDVESGLTRHGGGSGVLSESSKRGIDLILLSGDRRVVKEIKSQKRYNQEALSF